MDKDPGDSLAVVTSTAHLLLSHGHATSGTIDVVDALAANQRLDVTILPDWVSTTFVDSTGTPLKQIPALPAAINMRVVTGVITAVDEAIASGEPADPGQLLAKLREEGSHKPFGMPIFVLGCVTGACALAVIFGARYPITYLMVALAAGVGGVVRRLLGKYGMGPTGQAFAAAFIGGIAGALSVHIGSASDARLVAVCPAMVLVPGPHLLNGALDIAARRMSLGLSRLAFGSLIVLGICAGLLTGLAIGGTDLPVVAASPPVELWRDVLAAGVAAASYPIYFSLPWRLTIWPVLAGAAAHALRWISMTHWGADVIVADFLACLLAGLLLTPAARIKHASFAGVGFAAVVALVPGVFVFRMIAGMFDLAHHPNTTVLLELFTDGSIAFLSLISMAIGLVLANSVVRQIFAWYNARQSARTLVPVKA